MSNAETQILDRIEKNLQDTLAAKRLPKRDRMMYETMQLFVIYMRDDHEKIRQMYPFYQIGKWAGGILVSANLIYLFNLLIGGS